MLKSPFCHHYGFPPFLAVPNQKIKYTPASFDQHVWFYRKHLHWYWINNYWQLYVLTKKQEIAKHQDIYKSLYEQRGNSTSSATYSVSNYIFLSYWKYAYLNAMVLVKLNNINNNLITMQHRIQHRDKNKKHGQRNKTVLLAFDARPIHAINVNII